MNSEMVLYHGSTDIIGRPVFGRGKRTNDYGLGFYCTESQDLAKEWACGNGSSGYANEYHLNMENLSVLDINSLDHHVLRWTAILLDNRDVQLSTQMALAAKDFLLNHYLVDISRFDVIRGYRADDSFFDMMNDFINGSISYEVYRQALHLGNLGEQIVLKSKRAFDLLEPAGYSMADAETYYIHHRKRNDDAQKIYLELQRKHGLSENNVIISDIIRGTVTEDDPRIQ